MRYTIGRGLAATAGIIAFGLAGSPAAAQDTGTVAVTGIDLAADTVEITNTGDADADVNGLVLCNFPAYAPIAGADPIAPGESITVDAGELGVALADDQGELGLYAESAFDDPDAIISYVEWGTADHQRSSVAVEAGVWDGGVVDAGATLSASVDTPTAAADWVASGGEPTLAATGAGTWVMAAIAAALLALGLFGTSIGRRTVAG